MCQGFDHGSGQAQPVDAKPCIHLPDAALEQGRKAIRVAHGLGEPDLDDRCLPVNFAQFQPQTSCACRLFCQCRAKPFQKDRKDFTAAEFTRLITPGFEYLRRIEPFLLGGGGKDGQRGAPIYPENPAANWRRFADGEVDMGCGFGLFGVTVRVGNGTFPASAQTRAFPKGGMILNKNFIGIPNNTPNPAAALVLANLLSSPEAQISKLAAIGSPLGLDLARLEPANRDKALAAAPKLVGTTLAELGASGVPDFNASLVQLIERIWADYIERQSTKPLSEIVAAAFAAK